MEPPADPARFKRRKPRFLLTGLMKCGCCGGGFSTVGKDRFGCSNARNKGQSYCDNTVTLRRQDIEGRILHLLSDRLVDPELTRAFVEEYIAERNRFASTTADDSGRKKTELAKVIRDQEVLVTAMMNGTPENALNSRLAQLEARQSQLEAELALIAKRKDAPPPLLHPGIAKTYHQRVADLIASLSEPEHESESREMIRGLIDKIVAAPVATGGKRRALRLDLHGDLAGILRLAAAPGADGEQQKTACEQAVTEGVEFMVAGA